MSKTKADYSADRDLYSGLMRLHILHHAAEEPIFGLGMAEELARHGYHISPGTLYPLLPGLEKGIFARFAGIQGRVAAHPIPRATPLGKKALERSLAPGMYPSVKWPVRRSRPL